MKIKYSFMRLKKPKSVENKAYGIYKTRVVISGW